MIYLLSHPTSEAQLRGLNRDLKSAIKTFIPAGIKRAEEICYESIINIFTAGGDPKWAPLKIRGAARETPFGLGGSLFASLTGRGQYAQRQVTLSANRARFLYGTSHPLFEIHQQGTERIPARPMVPTGGVQQRALAQKLHNELKEMLTGFAPRLVSITAPEVYKAPPIPSAYQALLMQETWIDIPPDVDVMDLVDWDVDISEFPEVEY